MHFKQASQPKTVRITRQLAEQHVSLPNIGLDRRMNPYRVQSYVKQIKDGTMRPVLWARATCLEDNMVYRVNGQHTAQAYATAEQIPDSAYAIVEDYICDTREDLPRLWQTFDSKTCSRSTMEVITAYRGIDSGLADVSIQMLNMIIGGVDLVARGGMHTAGYANLYVNPLANRIEAGLKHRDFILWTSGLITKSGNPHMHRVGVSAAMFATWSKCQRDCKQFWLEVREESDPDTQSATRKMAKWLMQNYARKVNRPSAAREEYVRGLLWWNAHRTGTSADIRYTPAAKVPAVA